MMSICPACAGLPVGDWFDLCDDHLADWVEPEQDTDQSVREGEK